MNYFKRALFMACAFLVIGQPACAISVKTSSEYLKNMEPSEYFYGYSYVQIAEGIQSGDVDKVQEVIRQGIDVNQVGKEGMTLLMWSLVQQNIETMSLLLEAGADSNLTTTENALWLSVVLENPDYLETLIKYDGDVNSVNPKTGETLIFGAVFNERINNLRVLIEAGANMNHQDISGGTVLHFAIGIKAYATCLELIDSGVDPLIKDRWGYSALDIVNEYGEKGVEKSSQNYQFYLKLKEILEK